MSQTTRPPLLRYGAGVASIVLATGLRLLLDPALGDQYPFATLFLAVLLTAWYGGPGPAVSATLLGAAAAARFLLPPREGFAVHGFEQQAGLVLFLAVGLGLALFGGGMWATRQRAEALAAQAAFQREELRTTLASIGDAVLVTDAAGRVVSLNRVAESLTGWASADAAGRPLGDVFAIVNERTGREVESPVARVLREGTVVGLANHTVLIARGGVRRPIDDSAAPIRGADGRLVGVVLVFRDVAERRQAEEAHRRLAAIVTSSDDAIIGKDLNGVITSWNAGAERVYGYPAAEVVGQPFSVLVPPDRATEVRESARRLHQGERLDHFETVRRRKDGARIDVSVSYSPIRDDEGHVVGTAVITRDITERKRAEERVRRGERELADFFDNASVGLHLVGPDGIILRANDAELALLGYAREEYVGRHIAEFHADQEEIADILRCLHAGERITNRPVRMRCKDGSAKDVLIDSSVLWEGGRFVHTRCFTRDVTEQRRAEEAARERERQLRLVTDNAPVFLAHCDLDMRFKFVNRPYAERFGLRPQDIIGKTIAEVLGDEAFAVLAPHIDAALKGQPAEFEVEVPYRGIGVRWMRCAYRPEFDSDGRVVGYVGAILDVTESRRVEQALREVEARFAAVVNHAPACIFTKDRQGRYLLANRSLADLVGRRPEEFPGRTDRDFFPPEVAEQFAKNDAAVIESGRPLTYEESFSHRGVTRTYLTVKFPLRDEKGAAYAACAVATEITDLKRAQEGLRESEERLRLALEAGRMGVWDWNVRTNEVRWSDNLEAVHGLAAGGFGGSFEAFQRLIHPDDRGPVSQAIARALQEGASYDLEFRNLWPDGSIHWMAGKGKVYSDHEGPARMIGVGMDVTARKRAEQDARFLADASATLAALVDHESTLQKVARLAVPAFADWCAVDMLDEGGALRRVAVAHADPAKVDLARDLHRRYPPDPAAVQGIWNILRTGQSEIVPEINADLLAASVKDAGLLGLLRELGLRSYMGVPLSARGKALGVITFVAAESGRRYAAADLAVAEDLAHRAAVAVENARLYQAVRQADRRKDEFLALLGHELRNPLAPIANALSLLKTPGVDAETNQWALEVMGRQVEHMVRLVDDLLDVSRIIRGKVELRRGPVELAAVVARAVETSRPALDAEGHHLKVTVPPEPLPVEGDLVRLSQVVSNLLNNAAKYTERGGQVWLTAWAEGDEAVLSVKDTGIGIAPDLLPRLFDMFFQAERRTRESQGGLGIGLALVKGIVELHGGTVEARSPGPGAGSEFVVRLPRLVEKGGDRPEPSAGVGGERPARRRVLVVDDNVDAADSLAMLLRAKDHEVQVAYDGPSALEKAKAVPPDIAFLDLGMPKMDGFELARAFRARPALKGVLLVALTGWGQPEDRERTSQAGFDHHLVKPVELWALDRLFS